jgi:RNA polymerase sigma-70 factor (ECF subfamily)
MDPSPTPEDLLHRNRTRALVDEILNTMPLDLRAAFILFEVEELPAPEVAKILGLANGTVASRVRRAREHFREQVERLRKRGLIDGGTP